MQEEQIDYKLFEEACNDIGIQSKNPDGTYRKFTIDLLDDIIVAWGRTLNLKNDDSNLIK